MNNWKHIEPAMASAGEQVLERLNDHGYQAFFVGGCVRDEIMKRPVTDMDITTSAKPDEVMELFPNSIPTGLQHGTVTVRMNGQLFEVTTFRTESGYEDFRRPSEVHFVDKVEDDLRRRDFTMNAIARNRQGELFDPFDGLEDIEQGIVRAVGLAQERFREDALRMLRGVRFASVFNYEIAADTWKGLMAERDKLVHIAMERVRTEMDKMLAGPYPSKGVSLLMDSELTKYVKEPVNLAGLNQDQLDQLDLLPHESDYRWGMLLQMLGIHPEEADKVLRSWTFSGKVRERLTKMLELHEQLLEKLTQLTSADEERQTSTEIKNTWKYLILKYGIQAGEDWYVINGSLPRQCYKLSDQDYDLLQYLVQHAEEWKLEMGVYTLKELALTGADLLRLTGRRGGPWLGKAMNRLLYEVATGQLDNKQDILIEAAKKVIPDEA